VRKIVQHYVLVAANSGLRVGEQRQLRWSDVQLERHSANGAEQTLARIHVRAETSKVRTSRTLRVMVKTKSHSIRCYIIGTR